MYLRVAVRKFGKFQTNKMHNFQLFYLFYFSYDMFRRAAIFKEEYVNFII
jgi:hypothetical protein